MKLPLQAKPIARTPSAQSIRSQMTPSGLCEIACNVLPEPLRSLCLAAC